MAKTLEQLAKEIFKECEKDGEPITEAEALEMAQMELGAREQTSNYAKKDEPKKERKKREVKLDQAKVEFIEELAEKLAEMGVTDIATVNPQRELSFRMGGDEYSVQLIKHRAPKK